MKIDRRSLLLLAIQLAIVSSIAAKYLYQRNTCPRVWTRAVAYDPDLVLRGRYLSMRLYVDACGVAQPEQENTGNTRALPIEIDSNGNMRDTKRYLGSILEARNGKLAVQRYSDERQDDISQLLMVPRNTAECAQVTLQQPVDFYIPEHAVSPLGAGKQLWVEVTVPPKGPPRPLNLAINDNGKWHPLQF